MLLIKVSVLSLKEKQQHNLGFPTFKFVLILFKIDLLNIIFDDFSI